MTIVRLNGIRAFFIRRFESAVCLFESTRTMRTTTVHSIYLVLDFALWLGYLHKSSHNHIHVSIVFVKHYGCTINNYYDSRIIITHKVGSRRRWRITREGGRRGHQKRTPLLFGEYFIMTRHIN